VKSIDVIEKELLANPGVKEIFYQKSLVQAINKNLNRISLILLGFSGLLLLIAVALINNTIRLSVYSKRFLIRSMQLVGATQSFIRRPFIFKGVFQGIYGAFIAIVLIAGIIYFAIQELPELVELQDINLFIILFSLIILCGILISWLSTYFAIRKYLHMKTDDLYY
jgi:cell division transport system permease protein